MQIGVCCSNWSLISLGVLLLPYKKAESWTGSTQRKTDPRLIGGGGGGGRRLIGGGGGQRFALGEAGVVPLIMVQTSLEE